MYAYYVNSRKDHDRYRLLFNDALNAESTLITTQKQLREYRLGEESIVLISDSFSDPYNAIRILMAKEGRMTIIAMTELPLPDSVPPVGDKKLCFVRVPEGDRELTERFREILGKARKRAEGYFWGSSPSMLEIRDIIIRQKHNMLPILLRGEIGTGKSRLAEWIAAECGLRDRFVSVNCSGLSSANLGMDKLFGHIAGSFTDGKNDRKGLIAEADGGILFLDEIQELSKTTIANLLTVLETGRYRPIGSDKEEKSSFRLITATSRSRDELLDILGAALMSRIEGIVIEVPPLRERMEDIPALIESLSERLSIAGQQYPIEDMKPWKNYRWPANVRELLYKMEYYGCSGKLPQEMTS